MLIIQVNSVDFLLLEGFISVSIFFGVIEKVIFCSSGWCFMFRVRWFMVSISEVFVDSGLLVRLVEWLG